MVKPVNWSELIDVAPDPMLVLDEDNCILSMNTQACELFALQQDWRRQPLHLDDIVSNDLEYQAQFTQDLREIDDLPVFTLFTKKSNGPDKPIVLTMREIAHETSSPNKSIFVCSVRDVSDLFRIHSVLQHKKEVYEILFNSISDAVFFAPISDDGQHDNFIEVNATACSRLGYTREQMLQLSARSINPKANLERVKAFGRRIIKEKVISFEAIHRASNGTLIPVAVTATHIQMSGRHYVLSIARDLRRAKEMEHNEHLFGRLMNRSWDTIIAFRENDLGIVTVNDGAIDNLGYTRKELEKLSFLDIEKHKKPDDFRKFCRPLTEGLQSHLVYTTSHFGKSGAAIPVEVKLQISHSEVPALFLAHIQDISERIKTENELHFHANFDSLTGLPNRSLFLDRLSMSINTCNRTNELLAVLFIDLDGFKTVNDTFGHGTGDELLRHVANILSSTVRKSDTVSRFGGDEFMLLLNNIHTYDGVEIVAKKLVEKLSLPLETNGTSLQVSASIGIALYPLVDINEAEDLIQYADNAMYSAKQSGKNTFKLYSKQADENDKRYNLIANSLRNAQNHDEFFVVYQPRICLERNSCVGAEALLRWRHPHLGLISPGEFIPIAENIGHIINIDRWVLAHVLSDLHYWLSVGRRLYISVNISPAFFCHADFISYLQAQMQKHQIPPGQLEIEITEGAIISKEESALSTIQELKNMGIRVSLDDFGSGYSSLSYVKKFPIDVIKIDKSFIDDYETNSQGRVIVETIISMARKLDISVTAEGIETESQLNYLRSVNCHEGQGYYFSRPCPSNIFIDYLDQNM